MTVVHEGGSPVLLRSTPNLLEIKLKLTTVLLGMALTMLEELGVEDPEQAVRTRIDMGGVKSVVN